MERSPAELLAEIATIGGYFAMSAGRPGRSGAVSLAELQAGGAALERSVAYVGERLSTGDQRVAASIFFQGLAARLWSPVVAAHVLGGGIGFAPERTWWHPTDGCSSEDPATGTVDDVWPDLLDPLAATIRSQVGLSAHILRGNAASALVGSLAVLGRTRPELASACGELARTRLATGPLAGTGEFHAHRGFVRRSCCLFYRVPGGGLCGDCVLANRPT